MDATNRVSRVRFATRLETAGIAPGQREHREELIRRVVALKDSVIGCPSLERIRTCVRVDIGQLFSPDFWRLFPLPTLDGNLVANQLVVAALRENCLIYVPDTQARQAVVNGQRPREKHDLYSLRLETLEVDPEVIRCSSFGSIAAVPLISGLDNPDLAPEAYPRQGALFLGWARREALEPHVHLIPLEMYSEYLAVALSQLNASLPL